MSGRETTVAEEYARLAEEYDERWSAYTRDSVEATVRRVPTAPYARILDVGCGTGAALEPLARRFESAALCGADPSLAMLRIARTKLPDDIALLASRGEALPFIGGAFDLLVTTSALHFFGDIEAGLREFHRVLRPGGTLIVTDWCDDFLTTKSFDRVMRLLGRANFTTLGSRACRTLLGEAGFSEIRVERYRIDWFWGLMTAHARKPGSAE